MIKKIQFTVTQSLAMKLLSTRGSLQTMQAYKKETCASKNEESKT